jgi:Protein of unknown function (DUF1573)/Abnormal spindle-like microcephaly-assoc'd, ASPM-SPD-2-Hydin
MLKNILLVVFCMLARRCGFARCGYVFCSGCVAAMLMLFSSTQVHAQIGVSPSFAPATVASGSNAVLTIIVRNFATSAPFFSNLSTNVPLPLVGFELTDSSPVSNTCPSAVDSSVPSQITLTALATPTIASGFFCTIELNVIATGLPGTTGTFTAPALSLAVIQGGAVNGPFAAATASAAVSAPSPTMTVAVAPTTVLTNSPATLTYTLTNPVANDAFIGGGTLNVAGITVVGAPTNTCGTFVSPVTGGYTFGMGFIPGSGSCTITLTVQSATAGVFTFNVVPGNLNAGGGNTNSSTATLTVTAPTPLLLLDSAAVEFALQTINTTSPSQTVTLTNDGTANLTLNAPTSTGPFAFTTTCPFFTPPVAPGGSCTFTITFTPTVVGAATGTIDFSSNAPSSPTSISLSGIGSAVAVPGVVITPVPPTPLTFAAQTVATTSTSQNILVTNAGAANLLIGSITITTGAADFARVAPPPGPPDCLGVLAPAAQCAIAIAFTPRAVGPSAGNVQILTNAIPRGYDVPLAGTGAAATVGLLSVSDAINFGDQIIGTSSSPQTVFISNVGNGFVFVNGVGVTGPNAADFQSSGICGGLVPGASCAVSISFNPATIGPKTAQLAIGSDAQNAATVNAIGLSGNGVPLPRALAALSATAVGFGNIIFGGTAAPQTVTLTNNGTLPLLIQSATTSAEYTQANNCPASLNPQASCTISLRFTPFGLGPRAGEFVLNSNTADSPNRVLLSGNGCRWFKPPGSRLFANICRN